MDLLAVVERVGVELLKLSAVRLPGDVQAALEKAYGEESSEIGRSQLKNILENVKMAGELERPICQDTGLISYFVRARGVEDALGVEKALTRALVKATEATPLRPNAVHPLTRKNTSNNTGAHLPNIEWSFEEVGGVEVTAMTKGAGSENMSRFTVLKPSQGLEGIKEFVVRAVVEAGGQPCPPTILGVGIGGPAHLTLKLAKLALLRPMGSRHREEEIANLEEELLRLVNTTGVGPMGLGGRTTSLDVRVEYAHCHTGSLPVAVNFQCWADRRATALIRPDLSVEYR